MRERQQALYISYCKQPPRGMEVDGLPVMDLQVYIHFGLPPNDLEDAQAQWAIRTNPAKAPPVEAAAALVPKPPPPKPPPQPARTAVVARQPSSPPVETAVAATQRAVTSDGTAVAAVVTPAWADRLFCMGE